MTSSTSRPRRLARPFALGAAVLVVALAFVLFVYPAPLRHSGVPAGSCVPVPIEARVPDIAMDDARGVAYLAYLDSGQPAAGRAPRGTVMLLDLNRDEPSIRAALVTDPPNFQPMALSLYAPEQGSRRLLVADRGTGARSSVQIFQQSPSGIFELVRTVQDDLLTSPTAIRASGPEQFYVRNEASGSGFFARLWKHLAGPRVTVVYYDGLKMTAADPSKITGSAADAVAGVEYVNQKARKRLVLVQRDERRSDLLLCRQASGVE
jgi:hypothetical protein